MTGTMCVSMIFICNFSIGIKNFSVNLFGVLELVSPEEPPGTS